jgi:K+-transporting ATPase KdpF subunit
VTVLNVLATALAIVAVGYLFYALARPERF